MNTFESIVTCKKCKKSYTGLFMEDELAMTSDMCLPLDLTCQHCGYDNLNNQYTTTNNSSVKNNLTSQQEQEAKKQAELAKKQEILARLLAQCSTPPPHRITSLHAHNF